MSHLTSSRDHRCPLCGRSYPAEQMVHHLALHHMLHLDRDAPTSRKSQQQLLHWPHYNPHYRKREPDES
jgi:hypothetical protein